jgi:D-lactate dehydrogenase (cytochrome)
MLIEAINRHNGLDHAVAPTLFLEFHGTPTRSPPRPKETEQITAEHGGTGFAWATDEAQRRRMWDARHLAYDATRALRPGTSALTTDVAVPSRRWPTRSSGRGRPRRARPHRLDPRGTWATATST